MKRLHGFTVVELLIVITIMGILLVIASANLTSGQKYARDDERKADITNITQALEDYYNTSINTTPTTGRYPSTVLSSSSISTIQQQLRDINPESLRAPNVVAPNSSFVSATNTTETTTGVSPQPTISQYVYQPLQTSGSLCTTEAQECRRFNLFYRLERDNTVYKVMSKYQ